jgi:hypothetical protein
MSPYWWMTTIYPCFRHPCPVYYPAHPQSCRTHARFILSMEHRASLCSFAPLAGWHIHMAGHQWALVADLSCAWWYTREIDDVLFFRTNVRVVVVAILPPGYAVLWHAATRAILGAAVCCVGDPITYLRLFMSLVCFGRNSWWSPFSTFISWLVIRQHGLGVVYTYPCEGINSTLVLASAGHVGR